MPEEMPIEELRGTFAARQHTLDYLTNAVREQSESKTLTSYLITGPRGSGKTTIVLMLRLCIKEDERLDKAWLPVRFPEELPAITSLRDLLSTALHSMAEDEIPEAREWYEKVESESEDERSQDLAIEGLRRIAAQQDRRLILFLENLDLVFERGLDDRTQGTLRRLLMDSPFMMVIGTAVMEFPQLQAYDRAFFNYFCPVQLDRLEDGQVREILFRRAEYDGNDKFAESYRRHKASIKVITRLTGGNPRLIVMLYEVLSQGNIPSTVEMLRSLVDDLTPLLKDILEHQFSHQQSKILDALMRAGGTATPADVAKTARLTLNTVTTQLSRLKTMQIVEVHGGGKGRPAYYTVPDQLFCTWYQMRYLRPHRRRIELFVEVLRAWFEEEERLRVMKELAQKAIGAEGKPARDAAMTLEYFAASLKSTIFHPEARAMMVRTWLQIGHINEAAFAVAEDCSIQTKDRSHYGAAAYIALGKWLDEQEDLETAIRMLRAAHKRTPDDLQLLHSLGVALGMSGNYAEAQQYFDRIAATTNEDVELRARALVNRLIARENQGDTEGAIADSDAVLDLDGAPNDLVAHALVCRGKVKSRKSDMDGAIADFDTVLNRQGVAVEIVANALFGRGFAKSAKTDWDGAIDDYSAVLDLKGKSVDRVAEALINRGVARANQGEHDGAIGDFLSVLEASDAEIEVWTKVAMSMAIRVAYIGQTESELERVLSSATKAFNLYTSEELAGAIETVLQMLALPDMKGGWSIVFRRFFQNVPSGTARRIEFFKPVAEILETGDLSKLDPLPPEQREFVREVLRKFETEG